MKTEIVIEKVDTGIALINLPFELKDSFREVFKSAKWNPYQKYWVVGVRSKNRLIEFIDSIKSQIDELDSLKELQDAKSINDDEMQRLKYSLLKLEQEINAQKKELGSFNEVKELLASMQEKVIVLQQEKKTLDINLKNEKEETIRIVDSIIDVEKIRGALKVMIFHSKKIRVENKNSYYSAQSQIKEEELKLNAKELTSPILRRLIRFNWNRPTRDNPAEINIEELYKIEKLDE